MQTKTGQPSGWPVLYFGKGGDTVIDFHCHVLPGVDDGAVDVKMSLAMLRKSFLQGVDLMVSTCHFYANEEYPQAFLDRRNRAFQELNDAMLLSTEVYPKIILGAEVLYFPGISQAEGIDRLKIGASQTILIEPPMMAWSDEMLDEIVQLGENLDCTPVIAHVDRYMTHLKDEGLMERVRSRGLTVQVNGSYFLDPKTRKAAVRHLKNGDIQLIGSDCHNLDTRAPNLGEVWKQMRAMGLETEMKKLHQNAADLLLRRGG